jgi:hypothetical protein
MVVRCGAVPIGAQELSCIGAQNVIRRTYHQSARAFEVEASVNILLVAGRILAGDLGRQQFRNHSSRWFKGAARRNVIAACISVLISTPESTTRNVLSTALMNKSIWTLVCVTHAFLSATLVPICVPTAIPVITDDVLCIVSQKIIWWAGHHCAPSLVVCTSEQILLIVASGICTFEVRVIGLQNKPGRRRVFLACRNWIAARVAIKLITPEALAVNEFTSGLRHIFVWALISDALAFRLATQVKTVVGAADVFAKNLCGSVPLEVSARAVIHCAMTFLAGTSV